MIHPFQSSVQSVSELTSSIKQLLEGTLRFVAVSGEISNLKTPYSGHSYFTLKDDSAQIRCVLFKGQKRYLKESLSDGQQIICRGRVSVYEPRGDYQLIVDTVDQHGAGLLQLKFAALKEMLAGEGLFDLEHKKQLPPFPQKIVVLSSATGAAIRDFLKICSLRKTTATIQVLPVPVQGTQAAPAIVKGVELINRQSDCDLIVVCRGGGSIEDLWAFNEESVARAIFASRIPVVTGIGHETDTTIADLCSDLRCPTPTGAAERIIPDNAQIEKQLDILTARLKRALNQRTNHAAHSLALNYHRLGSLSNRIEKLSLRLDPITERLQRATRAILLQRRENIAQLELRLQHQAPLSRIELQKESVCHLQQSMALHLAGLLQKHEDRLGRASALLQGVSPLSTLSRGYSIVQKMKKGGKPGQAITQASQVEPGEKLKVRLNRGGLVCEVLDIEGQE